MKTIPSFIHPLPVTESLHIHKVFWKGGFPGLECSWNTPQNWHNGQVPGWKSLVVITPTMVKNECFPIIDEAVDDVTQIEVKPNAQLTILDGGKLRVDGLLAGSFGVINKGTLVNEGELDIKNTIDHCIHNLGLFINETYLSIDKTIEEGIRESEESSFVNCGEILELVLP